MEKELKAPKLRFPGFTDDWEQRKLSELATMHARIGWQNLRTSEFLDSGDYMLITGTDFEDGKVNYSTCHYVEKERYDQDKNIQIKNGSILITKDGTLGKVAYVEGLSMPATLNAGVFNVEVRDENETDRKYLFQFLKAPFLMDYVAQKATGGTIKHLNQNILVDFPIAMPSKAEQIRIGEYFTNIDNLITLHQRKLDTLKKLKKGFLQKMFPKNGESVPEIRFPGFTDAWEQRKLGNIANFINGRAYSQSELQDSGKYKILRVGNFYTNDSWYYSDMELDEKFYANKGDLLYTWSATFGPHIWDGDKVIYHYHIWKIELANSIDKTFAIQLLEKDKANILSNTNGSTMIHITKAGMEEKIVTIPAQIEEQMKIGSFLDKLDNLITLHQRKLDTLKKFKQGMLQQMFI